ncbi:MAG: efflux RND transporter periplasmic adaptor subunit [Crocinitomicaceae bacterium]|nr:efflux RND transporter periplasmic adaptor subunit [Crocinitomicaceae bacterium]
MKTSIIGLLIALFGALVLASCGGDASMEDSPKEEVKLDPMVTLDTVRMKSFTHEIRVQGNVETDEDITLSAEMGGLITRINVKEGQTVRKGAVIAMVDASILSSNVQELNTQLEYAQYMLDKQLELQKRGVGSEFDLETAKNQVNSLKASMRSLNTQRGKATIRAPFTGVVDQVFAKKGQMAGPSSPIVRLVNNTSVDIVSTISEKHFSNVKVGTPISVSFPNYSDTVLELKVSNVGNYIEPTNRTFRVMANIPNNKTLLPNMLAEVSITDMNVENGMVIPSKSILKDQNNNDFIFVARVPESDDKADKKSSGKKSTKKKADKGANTYTVYQMNVVIIERFEGEALIQTHSELSAGALVVVEGARGISNEGTVRAQ